MVDGEPRERTPAKKAAVKKAVAKKAAAKKTTSKLPAKKTAAKKTAPPAVIVSPGSAETPETIPAAPVASTSPRAAEPTLVERVLQMDWMPSVRIALPAVVVLLAASCIVTSFVLTIPNSAGSPTPGYSGVGGFFRGVALISSMAFGSSVSVRGSGGDFADFSLTGTTSVMPLTLTILTLGIYCGLCRRYAGGRSSRATIGVLVRAALIFAVVAMIPSFFAHATQNSDGGKVTVGASPIAVVFWALGLTLVVGFIAMFGRSWLQRLQRDETTAARLATWRLPVEGGLATLVATVLLGGVSFVLAVFIDGSNYTGVSDIARAMPVVAGLFVNIGLAVTAFSQGAKVGLTGSGLDSHGSIGYIHLHGLSPFYLLLLLLPVVSVRIGIAWMMHRRREEDDRTMARACYRMCLPFALAWLILAIFSRVSVGADVLGGVHVGPQLLIGFGLALGWSLVLGAVFGQLMLNKGMRPRTYWSPRLGTPTWQRVTVVSLLVVVIVLVADIATGGAPSGSASTSTLRNGNSITVIPQPAPTFAPEPFPTIAPEPFPTIAPVPVPVPTPGSLQDYEVRSTLYQAAFAEDNYQRDHGRYTTDSSALDVFAPAGVMYHVARADKTTFCLVGSSNGSGQVFSYDSQHRAVVDGNQC